MSLSSPWEGTVSFPSEQTEQKVLLQPLCKLSSETPIWKVDLERVTALAGWQINTVNDQHPLPCPKAQLARDPIVLIPFSEIALSHLLLWSPGDS